MSYNINVVCKNRCREYGEGSNFKGLIHIASCINEIVAPFFWVVEIGVVEIPTHVKVGQCVTLITLLRGNGEPRQYAI